jgi:hypothetical protein
MPKYLWPDVDQDYKPAAIVVFVVSSSWMRQKFSMTAVRPVMLLLHLCGRRPPLQLRSRLTTEPRSGSCRPVGHRDAKHSATLSWPKLTYSGIRVFIRFDRVLFVRFFGTTCTSNTGECMHHRRHGHPAQSEHCNIASLLHLTGLRM